MAPVKFCGAAGCRVIVPVSEGYCQKHKASYNAWVYAHRQASDGRSQAFYRSSAWQHLAHQTMLKTPFCEACQRRGITRKAEAVDHIIPIKQDWSKRLDPKNLQCLCKSCHRRKTNDDLKH